MTQSLADVFQYRTKLTAAERKVAELAAEQSLLTRRREALSTDVGLAKGRLANKGSVGAFLEQLQADANARLVSNYEMLLTALVTEVLPNEAPIGLELQIERGQPSLDIVSRRSSDRSEDIYEDQGGALTNLVSLGLRMIGVVRSGMNRFLLLDESDCWIATERVPAFYGVVKDAARKIGVQCLAVSHHDVTSFNDGISIARLSGHPELPDGVRIENDPRPHQWTDDEKGIRWVRLKNFQGYVDETLHLTPGVNALVGANNIGKSSFVRAFRAVFYGEARDSLIRWGERMCTVEFGMPGGRILSWDRQARRNPINRWRYLEVDGSLVGEEFDTGGRSVPAWIMSEFKIGPLEGMDIHATKQKEPVFLLNQSASKRAAVLSIGQEASHIRAMVTLHKEQCAADSARVKEGEAEMGVLLERLAKLADLPKYKELIEQGNGLLERLQATADETKKLTVVADNLSMTSASRDAVVRKIEALAALPEANRLREIEQQVTATAKLEVAADHLAGSKQKVQTGEAILRGLDRLPETEPRLIDNDRLIETGSAVATFKKAKALKVFILTALANLPEAEPTLIKNERIASIGSDIQANSRRRAKAAKVLDSLERLPSSMPVVKDTKALDEIVARIDSAKGSISKRSEIVTALEELPAKMPDIIRNDEAIRSGRAIRDTRLHVGKIEEMNTILADLPSAMPQLLDDRAYSSALALIGEATARATSTKRTLSDTETEMRGMEMEINSVVEALGHTCPLCHNTIDDASSLLKHNHMGTLQDA